MSIKAKSSATHGLSIPCDILLQEPADGSGWEPINWVVVAHTLNLSFL